VHRTGYILVVESDDLIRELLQQWLGDAGYTVIVGDYRTRECAHAPVLVIANIGSPRCADSLIGTLRAVYAAPMLVVSARFRRGASTGVAQALGVSQVLPKPFTREELLSAVREAIAHQS
jgi:DNA-binding response OmpR family regulator